MGNTKDTMEKFDDQRKFVKMPLQFHVRNI